MPPSPSLLARMMNDTYFTDTMIMIAQKTSEMTPYTCGAVVLTAW